MGCFSREYSCEYLALVALWNHHKILSCFAAFSLRRCSFRHALGSSWVPLLKEISSHIYHSNQGIKRVKRPLCKSLVLVILHTWINCLFRRYPFEIHFWYGIVKMNCSHTLQYWCWTFTSHAVSSRSHQCLKAHLLLQVVLLSALNENRKLLRKKNSNKRKKRQPGERNTSLLRHTG